MTIDRAPELESNGRNPDAEPEPSGAEPWVSFAEACVEVGDRFESNGAVGLIVLDASPLARIEGLAGPSAFERAFNALKRRVQLAARKVLGDGFCLSPGPYDEEHLLMFVHRPRDQWSFFVHGLSSAASDLRRMLDGQLRKVGYPYITDPAEVAVGHAFSLWRPFQRPESQLRQLVESALICARFELERVRRERRTELEWILLERQIHSVYEQIVKLSDRAVLGYEGLARGPEDSGLYTPIALFSSAEMLGLDYELDCLCRQLALRGARNLPTGAKLFVNCLPASVHDPMFQPERMRGDLEALGLTPQDLVLEISERQAIAAYGVFKESIARFARLGFGIAVDDMGAGYSSLAAALELRPGYLKIDRSLIDGIDGDPPRQEMVRAIQVLADRTGAKVIAEGIETAAEHEVLMDLGVEYGQGFLFGRGGPIPTSGVEINGSGGQDTDEDADPE
jgi:EAL domain-containing protein (putative c-di-GMP-specific phosphodiesterase class I)